MKALFIPLKTEFFEAFRNGTKTVEYRLFGPRWNYQTCPVGRAVVLAKGYGRTRLNGVIMGFYQNSIIPEREDFIKCYGKRPGAIAACIKIKLHP